GLLDPQVRVHVRGGELRVDWAGPDQPVWLSGPAEVAFQGHFELDNCTSQPTCEGRSDMTTREARGIQAPQDDEETVARYLQQHPEFFEKHLQLLPRLRLPHARGSSPISLAERQVK